MDMRVDKIQKFLEWTKKVLVEKVIIILSYLWGNRPIKIILKWSTRVFNFQCKFIVMHVLVLIVYNNLKIYNLLNIYLAKTDYNVIY